MLSNKTFIIGFLLIIAFWFFLPELDAQCAMCRATVEKNLSNPETAAKSVGGGLNKGILYLMSVPYIAFSVIAFFWYKSSKGDSRKGNSFITFIKQKLS